MSVKSLYKCPRCPQEFSRRWNMCYHSKTQHGYDPSPKYLGTKPSQLRVAHLGRALKHDSEYSKQLFISFLDFMSPSIMAGIKSNATVSARVASGREKEGDQDFIMNIVVRNAEDSLDDWLKLLGGYG